MNSTVYRCACVIVFLACTSDAMARRAGAPIRRTGSPDSDGENCQVCHAHNVGTGSVAILGAPAEYQFDVLYDLTVRISDPVQLGAGFEISVENEFGTHIGTLVLSDATNTRFAEGNANWVTHTSTGVSESVATWADNGNSADYRLQWRAPSSDAGTITFWAAGNAINNNFNTGGDFIYAASMSADPPGAANPADIDGDGDVDLTDFATFSVCFGASVATPPPGCSPADAAASDIDGDGFVDLVDFSTFALAFGM
jgi:hypothetical protein